MTQVIKFRLLKSTIIIPYATAVQNKLEGVFKIGIKPQKHKRSDRIYF